VGNGYLLWWGGGVLGPKMRGNLLCGVRDYSSPSRNSDAGNERSKNLCSISVCLYSLFSYLEGGLLYYWL
jgi:hypothetical protein